VLLCLLMVPRLAQAQASQSAAIAGVVKDPSGAVLPGVTVEASSPVLIEKARSAVTDTSGQYRIVDLEPGVYTVTFVLTGFNTVKRQGIELTGSFVATVNADLSVGAITETVTITGASPIVDVQNSTRQETLSAATITEIPVPKLYSDIMNLVPGTTISGGQDVGGQSGPAVITFTIHGGRTNEGKVEVEGINVGGTGNGAGTSFYTFDPTGSEEVVMTTTGGLGETEIGGMIVNFVPRHGGNAFAGTFFANGANSSMVASNYTSALQQAGLKAPNQLTSIWDVNGMVGGPVMVDKLWFFVGVRDQGIRNLVSGMFVNKNCSLVACDPNNYLYSPDFSQQARNDGTWKSFNVRLTWQATPRNKFVIFNDAQPVCVQCLYGGTATVSPEAKSRSDVRPEFLQYLTWTSPVSNRLLFQSGVNYQHSVWGGEESVPNATQDLPRISELCNPGCPNNGGIGPVTYHSINWNANYSQAIRWLTSATYVTGRHSFKAGYQGEYLNAQATPYTNSTGLLYTLNNGVPNQITESADPITSITRVVEHSAYAQDQWTFGRLTLQGALRFDHAYSYAPQQMLGNQFFVSQIVFPAQTLASGYDDITPRIGGVVDLFGNGKTALKVSLGKYLEAAQASVNYSGPNPLSRIATSTTRSWNDANHNYAPDCNLLNPLANGECGALANQSFGTANFSNTYNPAILSGWNVRPSDWDLAVAVQQQLQSRLSVELGYFRRSFHNFTASDNLALAGAGAFTPFGITVPQSPTGTPLPGAGSALNGLYNVIPSLFTAAPNNLVTYANLLPGAASDSQYQYSNSVDLSIKERSVHGLTLQAGMSAVEQVLDSCGVRALIPASSPLNPFCHVSSGFLPDFRALGSYLLPRWDIQLSALFQSNPGAGATAAFGTAPGLQANYFVPNSVLVNTSLGRFASGTNSATSQGLTINVLQPGVLYGDRLNQFDLRVAKILKFGHTRTNVGLDLYNALNANPITAYNQTLGPSWLAPQGILPSRFAKVSAQFDF
jgi:hypothetical protein